MSSTSGSTSSALALAIFLGCSGSAGTGSTSPGSGPVASSGGDQSDADRGPRVALSLQAIDGGTINTSSYRGQTVILHFFAVSSLASQADTEQLVNLHAQRGESVQIIAVSMEDLDYPTLSGWRRGSDVDYLVATSSEALRAGRTPIGRIEQIPTTIVLDQRGRIAERFDGPLSPPALKSRLDSLQ